MSGRRLAALLLLVAWFAPSAAVGAVALHVALEHPGDSTAFAPQALGLLAHGHAHEIATAAHAHLALRAGGPTVKGPAASPCGGSELGAGLPSTRTCAARMATTARAAPSPPPWSSGPARLSLLSLLRI